MILLIMKFLLIICRAIDANLDLLVLFFSHHLIPAQVRLVRLETRQGLVRARLAGIQAATGEVTRGRCHISP